MRHARWIEVFAVLSGIVVLVAIVTCATDTIQAHRHPAAAGPPSEWTSDHEHYGVFWRAVPGGRLYLYDGPRGAALCFVPDVPK